MKEQHELLRSGKHDEADQFAKDTNMDLVGIAAWDILNPLLEVAGGKMVECGIDPRKFIG